MYVRVWKKPLVKGEKSSMIANFHVIRNTPTKPALNFEMIVEGVRHILYLKQVSGRLH